VVESADTVPVVESADTVPVVESADTVPVVESAETIDQAADESTARDEAIDLMGAEVNVTFGLGEPQADCVAELLVNRIGEDLLVVDGDLVDLNSFPDGVNQLAGQALIASVAQCGINPSVFR